MKRRYRIMIGSLKEQFFGITVLKESPLSPERIEFLTEHLGREENTTTVEKMRKDWLSGDAHAKYYDWIFNLGFFSIWRKSDYGMMGLCRRCGQNHADCAFDCHRRLSRSI